MSELALPEGWVEALFKDCIEILDNQRKPINNTERQSRILGKDESELYPYYGATGQAGWIDDYIFDEELIALGEDGVPFLDISKRKAYMLKGKTWVNNHAHVLKAAEGVALNKYLLHFFNSIDYLGYVNGGTRLKLTQINMKKIPVILPSLNEQKEIVRLLSTHLTTVSQIQARLDAIPKLVERFRQSVLNDAVTGRLTEEWREKNETKSINLNDITEFWREKYLSDGKKYKSATFESLSEKPILPNKWQYTQLGKVFDVYVGATPSRKESQYWSGKIPWVSSSEVAFRRIKDTKEKVTDVGVKNTSTSIHPVGTVMLAMIGQGKTRGQAAILDIEACHNQNTAAIRIPEPFVISDYLYFYLMKMYQETRMVGSGNNQKALNKSRVQSLAFRLPPINEQEQIVKQVNQLFAYADQIVKSVATAKARVDNLTQSIFHQAFTGNLTAEWRDQNPELISGDDSAEALLAKIKAEKKKTSKA